MPATPNSRLRLAFMGTPDFAVPTLDALVAAGHDICAVYCQPPRPAGRGQKPRPSPVQARAESVGLPVCYPTSLKTADAQAAFASLNLDAAVVVAYGLILPPEILAAPRLGCLNVHASLLPRWRGAAPIQRAIQAGDRETGITLMVMDAGLDTGPTLCRQVVPLDDHLTGGQLHDSLAALGGEMIGCGLADWATGQVKAVPQTDGSVTYAHKLSRAEGQIDWQRSADFLARTIRAFHPWPGCWFMDRGTRLAVKAATVVPNSDMTTQAGQVLDADLTIKCGQDALRLDILQRPGKAALPRADFLRGYDLSAGTLLGQGDDTL